MAVTVVLSRVLCIVLQLGIRGNHAFHPGLRVCTKAWIIFGDHDGGGGVFHEYGDNAGVESGLMQDILDVRRDILDLGVPSHVQADGGRFDMHQSIHMAARCRTAVRSPAVMGVPRA